MRHWVLGVALSMVPFGVRAAVAIDEEPSSEDGVVLVGEGVWVTEDGRTVEVGDGEGNVVFHAVAEVGGDGRSENARMHRVRVERAGEAKGGWLGVSIAAVPEAMADQLETADEGVLVTNVVKGSPADQAGLEAHDIILSIGRDVVVGGTSGAIELISSRQPGERVDVVVLRDGRESVFTVELGERKNAARFEWKFEGFPEAEIEDEIKTRGKMLFRGPDGEWITRELDELEELKQLPESIKLFMPHTGKRVMRFSNKGDKQNITIEVNRDGTTIGIEQQDGGDIIVRRTENGQTIENVYANTDELRDADKEAYELYTNAGQNASHNVFFHKPGDAEGLGYAIDLDIPEINWAFSFDDEHVQRFSDAMEQYRDAMENAEIEMPELEGLKNLHFAPMQPFGLGKPKHTFELRSDGTIEVRIRKGDSELVQLFDNENDLANRAPDLYEKFDRLMTIDPE